MSQESQYPYWNILTNPIPQIYLENGISCIVYPAAKQSENECISQIAWMADIL